MSASASVSMELAPFHNLRGKHVVGLYLLNGANVCSEKNDCFFFGLIARMRRDCRLH